MMQDNLVGKSIKGYTLTEFIDAGGFGAVYRAHQAVVEREVAVKIIWPVFANNPTFIRRFDTEAQLVAGLEHPHIVPLYDYWREPGSAYIVMRWLRGGHLRGYMGKSPWDVGAVVRLLDQIASALTFAHRYGVVHRDLKPENILLDEDGNAYLADFGIAQILSVGDDAPEELDSMGSPAYAAPEQLLNEPTSVQTDIYSLGVIIYELLAGQHPFPDLADLTMSEILQKRTSSPLPALSLTRPDLPLVMDAVIQRATALRPGQRFSDVRSFVEQFHQTARVSGSSGEITRQTGIPGKAISQTQRLFRAKPVVTAAVEAVPNPYRGLRAFQESDSVNFYGRDALTAQIIARLKESGPFSRFLAVVGPSGSGKSSVVKAGVIPRLRQGAIFNADRWFFVEMVPGTQPFVELEAALTSVAVQPPTDWLARLTSNPRGLLDTVNNVLPADDPFAELFLFIDQFEEVFTLVESEAMRAQFLDAIFAAATLPESRVRVVLTVRADFYDRPLLRPQVSELISKRTEVVIPLTPVELEQAIVEPARRVNVELEPGLVSAIIAEVNEQPGALPLLQYLMSELFERREGGRLTLSAYQTMGGVRGALARRADEIFTSMDSDQQEATRQLFLRLITLGEGTDDTRRRADLAEVTSATRDEGTMRAVVDILGRSRLLTFDRDPQTRTPTVEVTHEAILREWGRLRGWLDASRADVRMQRNLASMATEWENARRDNSYLVRGSRLEQFERWSVETNVALARQESEYLAASLAERQTRLREEEERKAREELLEVRARNRQRLLLITMTFAALLASGLAVFGLVQQQRATQESELATSLAQDAIARSALAEGDRDLAVLLALEANRSGNSSPQARRTLAEAALLPGTRAVLRGHISELRSVAFSPDGRQLVSAGRGGEVKLWDAESAAFLRDLSGHNADVTSVAYSPDGRTIVTGDEDYLAIQWDAEAGTEVRRYTGHNAIIRAVAISPDSRLLLTADAAGVTILWDMATGAEVRRLVADPAMPDSLGHTSNIQSAAFSPDGRLILTGSFDRTAILWDAESGRSIQALSAGDYPVDAVAFSPDSALAAIAASSSNARALVLFDTATLAEQRTFPALNSNLRSLAFTADGRFLVAGAQDSTVQVFDVATGALAHRLQGHTGAVYGVTVRRDGLIAASGSADQTVRLWNIVNLAELAMLGTPESRHTRQINLLDFSADGQRIFSASADGTLRVWDRASRAELQHFDLLLPDAPDGQVASVALRPDGLSALVGLRDGRVRVLDLVTGEVRLTFEGHSDAVLAMVYAQDGRTALSSGQDQSLILWDTQTGQEIRRFTGFSDAVRSLAITPDGERALSGSLRSGELLLWQISSGQILARLEPAQTEGGTATAQSAVWSIAISPDGRLAATGGASQTIFLWDLETRAERAQLSGHQGTVYDLAFTPDGLTLLSGAQDATMILWEIASGQALQRFPPLDDAVSQVALSPDGRLALEGGFNGIIEVWRAFTLDELIAWTETNRYLREWTCAERVQYRVEPFCS